MVVYDGLTDEEREPYLTRRDTRILETVMVSETAHRIKHNAKGPIKKMAEIPKERITNSQGSGNP